MKIRVRSQLGFSIVEMLIATILFLILSAVTYRVLRDQGKNQNEAVRAQKQNTMALSAMDRFKRDLSQVDPTWFEHGIASVYPHQGYGLEENFYTNSLIQSEGLNDAITFITREVNRTGLYALKNDVGFPSGTGGAEDLYGGWLEFDTIANFDLNDYILIYKPGQFAIGVITDITRSSPLKIKIRQLNATERMIPYLNTWNRNSGYVIKPGIIEASFDWNGTNTVSSDDNTAVFEANRTIVQVIKPITYELDWATTDGQPHGHGNAYILDQDGNRQKVLVRSEYTTQGINREYLTEANQLGFTYDVLTSSEGTGLVGFTEGDIVKNVGREKNTDVHLVYLGLDPDQTEGFVSTARIVGVHMLLGSDLKGGHEVNQKFNEIQVSLNPDLKDKFQDSGKAVAVSSGNISDRANITGTKQIGQPLYVRYPGTNDINVIVPVAKIHGSSDSASAFENGKLVVMSQSGCPINDNGCTSSTNNSEITFSSPSTGQFADSKFYPSNMIQISDGTNPTKILVGGFSVKVDDRAVPMTITRVPAMAEITIPANQNLSQMLDPALNPPSAGSLCSIGNCNLRYYDTSTPLTLTSGSPNRFKDTAGGFAVDGNDLYVASMTKTRNGMGSDSTLSLYKTSTSNPSQFEEVPLGSGLVGGKVITAISQTPITVDGNKYVGICTTRDVTDPSNPAEDGAIYMVNITDPSNAPIKVADHNFKCTSLQEMNGGMLVGGKLVDQTLQRGTIESIIRGETSSSLIYTDEVANEIIATGTKYYADGFYTNASGFTNPVGGTYASVFGWNTGASVQKISPLEYGVVLGNRSQIMDSHTGSEYSQQDFTTVSVNYGGMTERVLASIETDFENLNDSKVSAEYGETQASIPDGSILAGVLYYDDHAPRQTPSPLPSLQSTMTEANWFDFYMDYVDLQNHASPTSITALPDPASANLTCGSSRPPTCGI